MMRRIRSTFARFALTGFLAAVVAVAIAQPKTEENASKPDLAKEPTLYLVGYAHLDTEWRWLYPQVISEFLHNTLADNFKLFDKYPDYVFNFTGMNRYRLMKEYWPDDYARLKRYIAAGRWFPNGASIEEGDVNSPSLESYVRQFLYGNRYFEQEFGKTSSEFMLPDCFGFPASLPSVLAHCGLKGFSTQKLTWNSAVGIPFNEGFWKGPDGRGVIAALNCTDYGSRLRDDMSRDARTESRIAKEAKDSDGLQFDYKYYGTGDQGGAPDDESVQWLEKSLSGGGPVKVVSSRADQMFNDLTPEEIAKLPVYQGDLELTQHSAGSLSSQTAQKRWNHENENLAHAAEAASVAGMLLGGVEYPSEKLWHAWILTGAGQFHDLLAGTALPRAYQYAWNDQIVARNEFANSLIAGVGSVAKGMDTSGNGVPLVVFNPLSIEREDVVQAAVVFPGNAPASVAVTGPDGRQTAAQVLSRNGHSAEILFLASAPSDGFAVYEARPGVGLQTSELSSSGQTIENANFRVTVNGEGNVSSIYDKRTHRETLASPMRLAFMHEDPRQYPAWNMDWDDQNKPPYAYVDGPATIRMIENGPVRDAIEVDRQSQGSRFSEVVRLSAGKAGDHVEFLDNIDWKTPATALKATFPLTASNPEATYNLQLGTLQRGNNDPKKYEVASHQWFDLTDTSGAFGASVLSGFRVGSDKPDDNTLRLTLLYTPGTRGGYQDQGSQDWGHHDLLYGLAPHDGGWEGKTPNIATRLDEPLLAFQARPHEGPLGRSYSLLQVSTDQVAAVAIKKAEDNGEIIVRLKELDGKSAKGVLLSVPGLASAHEVDGQEHSIGQAQVTSNGKVLFDMPAYGLRAFALDIPPAGLRARLAPPRTQPLGLPFNEDVISTRRNRADGDFDTHGRTLPADQLPDVVKAEGIGFKIGPKADGEKNALSCEGQTLPLPPGGWQRLYLLAASSDGDRNETFSFGYRTEQAHIADWGGFIGQWDTRIWEGTQPELAYDWSNKLLGIEPGSIKTDSVAWNCDHRHTPTGDEVYSYCYLFKVPLDIPKGATAITMPNDPAIKIMAATAASDVDDDLTPATPLMPVLTGKLDAPVITPDSGKKSDACLVSLATGLYGNANDLHYTADGSTPNSSSPEYKGPFWVWKSTTIKARCGNGPIAVSRFDVDDTTPPSVKSVTTWQGVRKLIVRFSEPVSRQTAEDLGNYSLDGGLKPVSAQLGDDAQTVSLALDASPRDPRVSLRVSGVADLSPRSNKMAGATVLATVEGPVFSLDHYEAAGRGLFRRAPNLPGKAKDPWTLNFFVWMDAMPAHLTPIAGFGQSEDSETGASRYICRFDPGGIWFWGRNIDIGTNVAFDLHRWQMVTATFDGQTVTVYKDGKKLATGDATFEDAPGVVKIAPLDGWDHKRRFEGKISKLTIWDTALDEDGVRTLLAQGPGG